MNDVTASLLACPRCQGAVVEGEGLRCEACDASYPVRDGIPCFTDGAIERDQRLAEEWEAQAHARSIYLDEALIANQWESRVLPRLAERMGDIEGPVLDLGCGVGRLGRALAARGGTRDLIAFDFQRELLLDAKVGYVGHVEGDAHHMPFRDGAFAGIAASNTLHHVAEPERALAEMVRVLRPGGLLIAWDPRELAPLEMIRNFLRRNDEAFADGHRAFTVAEYEALLQSAGIEVEEVIALDAFGPLVANGLDLLGVGRLGVAQPLADFLAAADRYVADRDGSGQFGLMLQAVARRPS